MTGLLTINDDDRRKLTAFPEGKMLKIKKSCLVGRHYHKLKTEYFILIRGDCIVRTKNVTTGKKKNFGMLHGQVYAINPMTYHEFDITKGSVLIGLCSHPYDHTDDYIL